MYHARDTKLGRDVAIKVLPEEFSRHRERLERFVREAKLLAALNHANVATLYGFEESDGQQFLVMELVEGETLAERISRGPIPVDEAIPLFIQMAEGLEAAHEKGIVHRDLKPANTKITPDGKIKILDFGLAKAFAPDEGVSAGTSQSPTLTKGTALGAILGTASYMSPEQAKGKTTDQRTDIWAFGCVLFEALTGRKAFAGDDVSEILASVLRDEPDWTAAPASFSKLLRRCVRKDVRLRFQHIGDVRVELEEIAADPLPPSSRRTKSSSLPLGLALVVSLGLAAWGSLRSPSPTYFGVTRSTIELEYPLAFETNRPAIAISRDGSRMLAIVDLEGMTEVYVRDLAQTRGRLLAGTETAQEAFFSPDGQSIGFIPADNYLYTISLLGGAPVRGALVSPVMRGGTWVTDDKIVLNPSMNDGLVVYSGAERTGLTSVDIEAGERSHRWPRDVPGSPDDVLFTVATTGSVDEDRIAVVSLETGHTRVVLEGGYSARATVSGHLVFGRGGNLMVKPVDLETLEGGGAPVLVLENVSTRTNGAPDYDVSETGTLIYVDGGLWDTSGPVGWVDAQGTFEAIMERDGGPIWDAAISPDGERIAMTFPDLGNTEIWTHDIARGTSTRLTFDPGEDFNPIWSPDGAWIAFASEMNGSPPKLHRMRSDGSGTPDILLDTDREAGRADVPTSWSPDGRFLTVSGYRDVWLVPLDGDNEAAPLLQSEFHEHGADVSPDGKWLAYHSDESGRAEVYVQSFPGLGAKQLVSSEGGTWPQWDDSGKRLFYRNGNRMMQVDVSGGPRLTLSTPRVLFTGKYSYGGVGHSNYDVSKDGRFLMIRMDVPPPTTRVRLVTNWFEELERLVPTDTY